MNGKGRGGGKGGGGKGRGNQWRGKEGEEVEDGEGGHAENIKVRRTCLSYQQPYSITAQGMVPMKTRFDPVYASILNPEPFNDIVVPPAMLPLWGVTQFIAVSKILYPSTSTVIRFFVIVHTSPLSI